MKRMNTRRLLAAMLWTALTLATSSAQSAPALPPPDLPFAYDVMSVKVNNTGSGSVSIDNEPGSFAATNVSLKNLLEEGFHINRDFISGIPGSIDSQRFDVIAKIVDPDLPALKKLTDVQTRSMLLPLLLERFSIKAHTEIKTLAVYELVLAPGGQKFHASAVQNDSDGGTSIHNSELTSNGTSMPAFSDILTTLIHRTVIDRTALAGKFDLVLKWSPEQATDLPANAPPGIFTALQEQLGLKLQSGKGPVTTLVVDHVEMPSAN